MLLWVGLGNPEPSMARQRHNIGFMALDTIAIRHGFTPWRQRFKGLSCEGTVAGQKIIALKPLTYMNLSGESVQAAVAFFKIPTPDITVFHDDLDLAPGKVKVKRAGGAAGHNGLRSLDQMLGTQDYWRVRLGIGHPGDKNRVTGYVLSDFGKADMEWLLPCLDAVADHAGLLVTGKPDEFMTRTARAGEG
ncbi:MAG TPA: aminoacyl-tRNA hydrolase [Acidocella sp.]|nr:MAG: aminoacyl-tRNA hydrolase [Acidocella sp. 20-58-15]HQT39267.1 aminoacyl-tRNA hydrolase [Acidocella sp.]